MSIEEISPLYIFVSWHNVEAFLFFLSMIAVGSTFLLTFQSGVRLKRIER